MPQHLFLKEAIRIKTHMKEYMWGNMFIGTRQKGHKQGLA